MPSKFLSACLLFAMSLSAVAQYAQQPAGLTGEPAISPHHGREQHQLQFDRYECYGWAKGQSGYDPAQPGNGTSRDMYRRGFPGSMSGRGGTLGYRGGAAPPPPPPP